MKLFISQALSGKALATKFVDMIQPGAGVSTADIFYRSVRGMRVKSLFLCGVIVCLHAQPDPGDLLQRVTRKVLETVDRLPKYMCTQTIDRSQYEPPAGPAKHSCGPPTDVEALMEVSLGVERLKPLLLTTSDRLRLDVAVSGGREMYSWVGESRFEDRGLFQLVRSGALSTGSFASLLMVVFRDDQASFSYKGEITEAGRQLADFEFRVSVQSSHYIYTGAGKRVTTGYYGSILVDPRTADLERLTVHTEGLPPETGSCEASTTLDYSRVRLNRAEFLLPNQGQLQILDANGTDLRNSTVYSGCREFLGESTLRFDAAPEPGAPAAGKAAAADELPAGLPFTIALNSSIDQTAAAAGDKIGAKLTTAIRDSKGQTLVPKGAAVTARIVQIRRFYVPEASLRMALKLETVDIAGTRRRLAAVPDSSSSASNALQSIYDPVALDTQDPQAAVFVFWDKGHFVAFSGFESNWRTAP